MNGIYKIYSKYNQEYIVSLTCYIMPSSVKHFVIDQIHHFTGEVLSQTSVTSRQRVEIPIVDATFIRINITVNE